MKTLGPARFAATLFALALIIHGLATAATRPFLPLEGGLLDPTFVPNLPATPTAVAFEPDGRILVAGYFLIDNEPQRGLFRLNSDGSLDTSFRTNPSPFTDWFSITAIRPQPDGSILVYGSSPSQIARIESDGSWDTAYIAPPAREVRLASGDLIRFSVDRDALLLTVERVRPDGSVANSFQFTPPNLTSSSWWPGGLGWDMRTVVDSQGRLIVAFLAEANVWWGGVTASFFRVLPDGSLDPAYARTEIRRHVREVLYVADLDKVYHYSIEEYDGGLDPFEYRTFGRLLPDGTEDATYPDVHWANSIITGTTVCRFDVKRDGSYHRMFTEFHSNTASTDVLPSSVSETRIERYDQNGQLDADFLLHVVSLPHAASARRFIRDFSMTPDGRVLVLGNFTEINGVPRNNLARFYPATHDPGTRLVNISIRSAAGTDNATMIMGFVVAGEGGKSVLVRAIGPGLSGLGVTNALRDSLLTLYRGPDILLANHDWSSGSDPAAVSALGARLGAFPLEVGSKDAATIALLSAGPHTMHLTSEEGGSGDGLAEVYDADGAPVDFDTPRLMNVSARSFVGAGSQTTIAGFVIAGNSAKRVLIRAVGPGLSGLGVNGALADPNLSLFSAGTVIAGNDDWGGASTLQTAGEHVGAFALPADSKDSALLVTLPPGVYTAHVNGAANTTGVALIEVYEVP